MHSSQGVNPKIPRAEVAYLCGPLPSQKNGSVRLPVGQEDIATDPARGILGFTPNADESWRWQSGHYRITHYPL